MDIEVKVAVRETRRWIAKSTQDKFKACEAKILSVFLQVDYECVAGLEVHIHNR
jgi:hypothetical protein